MCYFSPGVAAFQGGHSSKTCKPQDPILCWRRHGDALCLFSPIVALKRGRREGGECLRRGVLVSAQDEFELRPLVFRLIHRVTYPFAKLFRQIAKQ
jgi:hypothetical protein